jgi:cell division transport system permease protein
MLGRSIRDAFKSIFRNFSLSLASASCITITLVIVALAIVASYNVQNFTKEIEKDLTIVVFMDSGVNSDDITTLKKELQQNSNVSSITFESKEEVKKQMQKESEIFNTILSNWSDSESPLKDTYKVKVKDVTNISKTAKEIKKYDNVSVVRYGAGMVDKMVSAFSSITKVTYGVVIALILVTVFLIVNTIKLTIYSRQKEIGIMRVVGASNTTIKMPFVIEGMFLGLIGSIIPVLLITYGYLAFYNHFGGHLFSPLIKLIKPEPFMYQAAGMVIIIGIVVGMIGSASAVRRYLKI